MEPVSLDDAKRHLRVTSTLDDGYIGGLITAARKYAERRTRRAFITQTWAIKLERFPDSSSSLYLPVPPLQSITSITYVDQDGATQTWSSGSYKALTSHLPGRVVLEYGEVWPTSLRDDPEAVVITFVAGYGDAATDVPQEIKQAILLMVGHWYANREPVAATTMSKIPLTVDSLLGSYLYLGVV